MEFVCLFYPNGICRFCLKEVNTRLHFLVLHQRPTRACTACVECFLYYLIETLLGKYRHFLFSIAFCEGHINQSHKYFCHFLLCQDITMIAILRQHVRCNQNPFLEKLWKSLHAKSYLMQIPQNGSLWFGFSSKRLWEQLSFLTSTAFLGFHVQNVLVVNQKTLRNNHHKSNDN